VAFAVHFLYWSSGQDLSVVLVSIHVYSFVQHYNEGLYCLQSLRTAHTTMDLRKQPHSLLRSRSEPVLVTWLC